MTPGPPDPRLLRTTEHYDDAVVVQVNAHTTLVQTVDFFTPVVDDPYWYGRIAAANSLSDVYAMGGRPLSAMNIVCFPVRTLGAEVLAEILRGGQDALWDAGAVLAGGHSVEDPEPKYGMAVTGLVDPAKVTFKGGLKPGQQLWLTKRVGTGVVTTAHKRDAVDPQVLDNAIRSMARLNAQASSAMLAVGASGATDITGFGLLGHALEMARASSLRLVFRAAQVPLLDGVMPLLQAGHLPGGSRANRDWIERSGVLRWRTTDEDLRNLLCDAQTSGGLLVGIDPERVSEFVSLAGPAWQVGHVEAGPAGLVVEA